MASVQTFQAQGVPQGLKPYNPSDPFASYYAAVVARNTPPGANQANFAIACEGCLRARGLIYFKKTPGDCPVNYKVSNGELQAVSLGQAAAGTATGILGAAGVIGGIATAGIGLGIAAGAGLIAEIFQNHAAAVKDEQSTLCNVAGLFNQVIAYLDSQVISGKLDPTDAVQILGQYCDQFDAQLDTIKKQCDAACTYEGIISAHKDFASIYYPRIYPSNVVAAQSPSNPAIGNTYSPSPLSAPTSVNPISVLGQANTSAAVSGEAPDPYGPTSSAINAALPVTSSDWLLYAGIAAVILIAFVAMK
jgi:hypothetical protein